MADADRHPPAPGSRVALRGAAWHVEQLTRYVDCQSIRLRPCGTVADNSLRTFLLPFDRCVLQDGVRRVRVVSRRRYAHVLRDRLLATRAFGETRTAATSSIELQPFQLEPVLAMTRHARLRMLIADGVGLGKTIQAGLIACELAADTDDSRALILLPAGLRLQWQEELAAKFALDAILADARWLVRMGRDLPHDVNPWSLPGLYLTSYDFVKQPEVLRSVEAVRWDLLIADEAHGATPGTARLSALQALGARARRVVLLSATPPYGDPAAMRALADVGRFPGEPPLTVFRRSRRDAGYAALRRTVLMPVALTASERLMHQRLDRYAARVWRESAARQDPSARLAAMVLKKRSLSTPSSLLVSVRRRIALLAGARGDPCEPAQLPLFDEDPLADELDDTVLAVPGLADASAERRLLEGIAETAEAASVVESKIRVLGRLFRRVREPVVVFTEYRDTVAHLADTFSALQPLVLTGAMHPSERHAVQRAFAAGGRLLLSTDAASEGLNLHHRCRLVVHFELPWMPMRLEQRAGRVDRFGQVRRVHEIMLVARHTSEGYVLGPLVRRIRTASMAGAQTGWASLSESAVASGVLGDIPIDPLPCQDLPQFEILSLTSEARAECDRITSLRRLSGPRGSGPGAPANAMAIYRGRWRTHRLTVVIRSWRESEGTIIDDRLLCVLVDCSITSLIHGCTPLRRIGGELTRLLTPQLLERSGALDSVRGTESLIRGAISALAEREGRLAAHCAIRQAPLQAGLFDRRAVQRAEAHAQAATLLLEETESRVDALSRIDVRPRFEIVAVHPGHWDGR